MNALVWLSHQQDGFGDLAVAEQNEMMKFSLLRAYFEARFLGSNASAKAIVSLASQLDDAGKIKSELIAGAIAYWRDRYVDAGQFTHHYGLLHLRGSDNVKTVNAVPREKDESAKSLIVCALTIVYRYRNNLFHGLKWAYGLQGQKGNFQVASRVLMATAEMARATSLSGRTDR